MEQWHMKDLKLKEKSIYKCFYIFIVFVILNSRVQELSLPGKYGKQ
jgi:hypothetical protein